VECVKPSRHSELLQIVMKLARLVPMTMPKLNNYSSDCDV